MDVRLVVVEGLHLGMVIPVRGPRYLIGRDPGCQLRPKSPTVSLVHCAILIEEDQVRVQDLDSTNGTLVNDRCLRRGEAVRVKDGDRLQVAQLIFALRIDAGPAPREASRDDAAILDYLMAPADPGAPEAMSRTVLLPSGPSKAGAARSPSPSGEGEGEGSSTLFAFRFEDPSTGATCFGLSPLQFDSHEGQWAARQALLDWAKRPAPGPRRLVLDLSAVESLPGSFYALLLSLLEQCRQTAGGGVRLAGASIEVRHWLALLKLDKEIACHEDRAVALAAAWDRA